MLEAVVAGSVNMADLLHEQTRILPVDRQDASGRSIHLDNAQSDDDTVLEIVANDAPGFLYRVTRVVAEAGCTVNLALVSTEQGKAVDFLHITRDKRPLTEVEQEQLQRALEVVIGTIERGVGPGLQPRPGRA
jgi:[protein-PII] uridylyltransferase